MNDFVQNDVQEFKQTIRVNGAWVTTEEAARIEGERVRREEEERQKELRKTRREYMREYRKQHTKAI